MVVQPDLCWTWSETPEIGFLITRLKYISHPLTTVLMFQVLISKLEAKKEMPAEEKAVFMKVGLLHNFCKTV